MIPPEIRLRRIGPYRLAALLGQSDAATQVYKAFDTGAERFVALKTIRKDMIFDWRGSAEVARFRHESQGCGKLYHPNIVAVYDYGEEASVAYLAMELVEGRTLASMFRRGESIPVAGAVDYVGQLLAGLAYAHERGTIHGGLQPREAVISRDEVLKIKGFWLPIVDGINVPAEKAPTDQQPYLAPEQLTGNSLDPRTDVYAAGALFYHMLAGRPPVRGAYRTLRHETLTGDIPAPSVFNKAVPPALDAVVAKAMAKRPADRFQSAVEFATTLHSGLRGSTATARAAVQTVPPPAAAVAAATKKAPFGRETLQAGKLLFAEGDPGDQAYIIESGVVQIYKIGENGEEIALATIGRGEILGEMALVDNQPRMAAARAIEDTTLMVIPRNDFQSRLDKVDKVTHKLVGVLVGRCRSLADEVKSLKLLVDKQ